jgi:arginyl-tRNA synthetase
MLTRKNDMALDFDFTKALEQSKDNPVFYVQYAHARACSVLRNKPEALPAPDFSTLNAAPELALIKKLAEWPRIIQQSAVTHEPHRIAFYLYDVASAFHALWSYGKENIHVRFLQDDNPAATAARMILVEAVTVVLSSNLKLLGVTPLQEM